MGRNSWYSFRFDIMFIYIYHYVTIMFILSRTFYIFCFTVCYKHLLHINILNFKGLFFSWSNCFSQFPRLFPKRTTASASIPWLILCLMNIFHIIFPALFKFLLMARCLLTQPASPSSFSRSIFLLLTNYIPWHHHSLLNVML